MVLIGGLTIAAMVLILVLGVRANDRQMTKLLTSSSSTRRYDAGSCDIVPAEDVSLVPYTPQPQPAPIIRIDTGKLQRVEDGPSWEASKYTPSGRTPSVAVDVKVPLGETLVFTLFVALAAIMLAWAFGWSWRVVAVTIGIAPLAYWVYRKRVWDALLWKVESITRRDITGDGQVGQPQPQQAYTLVNPMQARETVTKQQRGKVATERNQALLEFLHKSYTHGTSKRAHGIMSGSGVGLEVYESHRDALMRLGLAAWRNPNAHNAGWCLTCDEQSATELVLEHVA